MLVFRIKRPTGVTRGSCGVVHLIFLLVWILDFHGTEFKHFKRTVVQSDALLTVNDRSGEVILISAAVISIRVKTE